LFERSPWPLPHLNQLPDELDEPWYPALREALRRLHDEQTVLFGDSLAHWLEGQGSDRK
jgi:membrane protein